MLTQGVIATKDARPAYRPYRAAVVGLAQLSPHFVRVTFGGEALRGFGTDRLDQRIKLIFPLEHGPQRGQISDIGADDPAVIAEGTWYAKWRELPSDIRSPFRTYTVRAVRPELGELDVDMVAHADGGPASRWLAGAAIGDELVIVGPDALSLDSAVGIDWHPGDANEMLLIGDETAAPAICSILESLPADRTARAFIEIPDAHDCLPVDLAPGASITWLARGAAPHGSVIEPALRRWVEENPHVIRPALAASAQQLDDVDVDTDLLWDSLGEAPGADFYGWLAGESAMIKTLRRFLVSETGIDRKRIAFMGYWRLGKAEIQ